MFKKGVKGLGYYKDAVISLVCQLHMPRDLSASAAEEQKLKKAKADEIQKLKELGDKAVNRSNWEDAIEHYTSGIEIFRRAHDLEVEDGEEAKFYR